MGVCILLRVYQIKSLEKPNGSVKIIRNFLLNILYYIIHLKTAFDQGRNML
jgi:hypothetical protein